MITAYTAASLHSRINALVEASVDRAQCSGRVSGDEVKYRKQLEQKARERLDKFILELIKVKA